MKVLKYILVTFILFLNLKVYAAACSYEEQIKLNNDFSNIKITYEIENDKQVNVLIYNLTDNLFITYNNYETEQESSIFYYMTENGKYKLSRPTTNIEEYKFQIRSNIATCYGKILTTKKITKPAYNPYNTLEICENKKLANHSYCQKYITNEITANKNEVIKTLQEFIDNTFERITTKKNVEENKIDAKIIIFYSVIGIIFVGLITIIAIVRKKRGEL